MKTKVTLTIILFFIAITSKNFAQCTSAINSSFESWHPWSSGAYNGLIPDSWQTSDSITAVNGAGHSAVLDSTPSEVCDGTYSIKLVSISAFGVITAPGVLTNGTYAY